MRGVRYFIALFATIAVLASAARLVYVSFPEAQVAVGPRAASPPQHLAVEPPALSPPADTSDVSLAPSQTDVAHASSADSASVVAVARSEDPPAPSPSRTPTSAESTGSKTAVAAGTDTTQPPSAVSAPVVVADSHATPPTAPGATPSPDTVPPVTWQASPRDVARDSAYVMVSSGRLRDAIAVLAAWVKDHPSDSTMGLDLARLQARTGDWQGSIARYTALLEQARTPDLLYERGQTYLWSGDTRAGEADLIAAEALEPRAETARQLGDLYRWQGDFARSASWYRLALQRAPDDSVLHDGLARLDAAVGARLLLPGRLEADDYGSRLQAVTDNAGFDLYGLRVGHAFRLPPGSSTTLALMSEVRTASRVGAAGTAGLAAWGLDATISSRSGMSRLSATLGVLEHEGLDPMVRGSLDVDAYLAGSWLSASVRRLPAYEALWAPRMLEADYAGSGSPASATQGQLSLSRPFGARGELWTSADVLAVSDDNARGSFSLAIRQGLAGPLSLVYSGGAMFWKDRMPMYYSPGRYLSQALGIELARYRESGLSFAFRLTPGYAWIRDPAGTLLTTTQPTSAFQMTGGLELGYRRAGWDLLLSTGLGAGREGGYRSANSMLYIRRSR